MSVSGPTFRLRRTPRRGHRAAGRGGRWRSRTGSAGVTVRSRARRVVLDGDGSPAAFSCATNWLRVGAPGCGIRNGTVARRVDPVAELYVDGRVGERARRCAPRDPLPGRRLAGRRGRRGRRRGHRGRDRRRAPGLPRRALADARPPASAATCCSRVADLLERDAADVARMESLDTGKRLVESEYDVADVVSVFRHYGRVAAEEAGRMVDTGNPDVVSRIVHEPVGVCGLITPVELPAAPGLLEGRALPRGRQHVRAQAQRADPAHRHPPDAPARGGRAARRRRQPRARRRAGARVRRCPRTPGSTWSRSPAASRRAGGSWPPRPAP